MGNLGKTIAGVFLTFFGILLVYEATKYRLIDLILILGFLIAIVGIVVLISSLIDYSSIVNSKSFNELKSHIETTNPPLKTNTHNKRRNSQSFFNNNPNKLRSPEKGSNSSFFKQKKKFINADETGNPKAVLNVRQYEEPEFSDNVLRFTPNYDKPLKVTRKPKKRGTISPEIVAANEDKSSEILKALSKDDNFIETLDSQDDKETSPRDIKIDVNNPESLPVPEDLKSFVVSDSGNITSKESFEELSRLIKRNLLLQIPDLSILNDRFLSQIPLVNSRVIISEFDLSDMSYMLLISSLLKQGVIIKTLPFLNLTNVVIDDSNALILFDATIDKGFEYGAIYKDSKSIGEIKDSFEEYWEIADEFNQNMIINHIHD